MSSHLPLRWGILGLGNIAKTFAKGLTSTTEGRLVAVGSRTQATAEAFAKEHGGRAHGSYQALLADPEVDAIYISTPHPQHYEAALQCLRGGKAVLCEKPLAVNAAQASEMVRVARQERRFLMEAMWTRFLPAMVQCRSWLAAGMIGQPRMLHADFGFRCGWDPKSRLLDPASAGGGLLDVGVYAVALSTMVFGSKPRSIKALAHLGVTQVDEQAVIVASWEDGALATLSSAVRTETPQAAWIAGTEGRIELPQFWHGKVAILHRPGQPALQLEPAFVGNGYQYQAEEVARCIGKGGIESPLMSHAESVDIANFMDRVRQDIGLRYPMDASASTGV
jgi:dihydrodiol dehydrogenase / D-xylose 1-dehydrogenase (NADP)